MLSIFVSILTTTTLMPLRIVAKASEPYSQVEIDATESSLSDEVILEFN